MRRKGTIKNEPVKLKKGEIWKVKPNPRFTIANLTVNDCKGAEYDKWFKRKKG